MDPEMLQEVNECLPNDPEYVSTAHAEVARENNSAICLEDIDSGMMLEKALTAYATRIRQLKSEIAVYKKETDQVVDQNLLTNLELITLNQELEMKVKLRTRELESANEKLSELNKMKESLMHMIVHDMKNPLTAILGTLRLFEKNPFGLKPEFQDLLIGALGNGRKLLDMVEGILFISRMQTKEFQLKPERIDLITLIRQCLDLMVKTLGSKNLTFHFTPPCAECRILVDQQIIERVINNILNNAIKYSPAGSSIDLELNVQSSQVVLAITNWGAPIPLEHQQKIFELFTRVNAQDTQLSGTGIGLNFCKLAAEAHKGTIAVMSPVPPNDKGVKFLVTLPKSL
jgi:signal transduction histidine kinase